MTWKQLWRKQVNRQGKKSIANRYTDVTWKGISSKYGYRCDRKGKSGPTGWQAFSYSENFSSECGNILCLQNKIIYDFSRKIVPTISWTEKFCMLDAYIALILSKTNFPYKTASHYMNTICKLCINFKTNTN